VYLWGAYDKCTWGWLSGDKLESQLLFHVFDSDPPDVPGWRALITAAAVATFLLELALAIGLWFPRARRWLIPAGFALHLLIYVALPVTVFSALSCLLYLAYLDPDEVHAAIDRVS
jgi:amino acid transporter